MSPSKIIEQAAPPLAVFFAFCYVELRYESAHIRVVSTETRGN
jgi:hypothetical protein